MKYFILTLQKSLESKSFLLALPLIRSSLPHPLPWISLAQKIFQCNYNTEKTVKKLGLLLSLNISYW